MSPARRRALRAVVSALAGGGMTAAAFGAGGVTSALAGQPTESVALPAPPAAETTPTATTPPPATTTAPAPTTTAPTTTATTPGSETVTVKVPTVAPTVKATHRQKNTPAAKQPAAAGQTNAANPTTAAALPTGASNVALSPQVIAAQASALASTQASVQALGFYRIPLFLLPVYKAAAVQYGVPWQILAAINEIETNYGSDLSVSSAGAVGWMQFMPATWLQYGVDALDAGYADPYNPVDAIFAAARYLRAAGAATDLHAAILSYNHSEEYVSSVLLRAKLISTYPRSVIATLTGLVDGRLPVTGRRLAWGAAPGPAKVAASSATAGATALSPTQAASTVGTGKSAGSASTPGSAATPDLAAAAARAAKAQPPRLSTLTSAPGARVVAVENGRIVKLGTSAALGRYIVLRDIYGDVFTYAGLGSIAPSYVAPKAPPRVSLPLVEAATKADPAPSQPASAGVQAPVTLQVAAKAAPKPSLAKGGRAVAAGAGEELEPGRSKVRLFAHPGNPDAVAAAKLNRATQAAAARASRRLALKRGSVVTTGTVLGTVSTAKGASSGHLRFAIRPAGDPTTIDPGPVLQNWSQLQLALHPKGAKAQDALFGATAADVFLLSKAELQRTVLSDPGISVYACGRRDIAAGAIDKRVLALLAFLSRSGLRPTVTALRCGQAPVRSTGAASAAYHGNAVEISAINGTKVAGHQGAGSVTDLAIRTLLTLPAEFQPAKILSLMRYPGARSTVSSKAFANELRVEFKPAAKPVTATVPVTSAPVAGANGKAAAVKATAVPLVPVSPLSGEQWNQLVTRIGGLPAPTVRRTPSPAALPDTPAKAQKHG